MRQRFFEWLGFVTGRRYWLVIGISLVITLALGMLASMVRVEATWMSLLPEDSQSVESFQSIIENFGAATNIILAVEGPDKETATRAAEDIAPGLEKLVIEYRGEDGETITQPAVKSVDYRFDLDFFRKHALMLEKAKNLKKSKILFTDYNLVPFLTHINDVYESQWVYDSDNLTKQEKEAERGLDGMFELFHSMASFAYGESSDTTIVQYGVDALTIGDGYYRSSDKKMLLMLNTPTVSVNEIEPTVALVDTLDSYIAQYKSAHPDVNFGLTGMHVVMRDEMNAGVEDTMRNFGLAIILVLALFIFSFRMWSGPLLAILVLIVGITWDIGLAQLIIGRLNIITVMCSVVLIGLGIDYAVHFISSYTELRHKGRSIEQAVSETFSKIGAGLITGALTTAIAFMSIAAIGSPAFREFGFVTGAGIICCLLASIFLLPSVIVAKEKLWGLAAGKSEPKRKSMEFGFLGRLADIVTAKPWVTLILSLAVLIFLAIQIPNARMNRNYMDLEPEGLESIRLQREIVKRFHMSPDNMMAAFGSIEEVNEVQDRLNSRPVVGMVESIASVLPSDEKQSRRIPLVREINDAQQSIPEPGSIDPEMLVEQLRRLSDNIVEISSMAYTSGLDRVFDKANGFVGLDEDGRQIGVNYAEKLADYVEHNPGCAQDLEAYQQHFAERMRQRALEMSDIAAITLDMVPGSYRENYVSDDGELFLMAFYSNRDIWDGLFTSPFIKTVLRDVPSATGSPVFMREMVDAAKSEGTKAFMIALLSILILLFIDFRSVKATLVALVPLLVSATWLLGLMGLLDIPFTIINVIAFPLLIGIGIDDGVHVIHRYRVEGKSGLRYTMSSIGKPILLTSLTTMLGFGSLISSEFRGYIGLGLVVLIGIGLCFVTSVVVLPAIMKLVWGGRKEHPEFFRS